MIDSVRYREVSKDLSEGNISKEEAEKIIGELLTKETDFDEAEVSKLPALITENILLG
ncbi:MAG: hypothetical protein M1580_02655 [Candidatus Parvarchaeota archaeon]|nr:hypothetical protein [Candidatus Parvarchaeota archaeon]